MKIIGAKSSCDGKNSLIADVNIPNEVQTYISSITPEDTLTNTTLLRVTIWIQYYEDPVYILIQSGLIFDE